ncbi:hypothetical protein IMZ48_46135 [Candidatus Bathyarchaeota archaeon]|nr:hypothetical protein [Candidatus Bathyarchaeota archaeon]
MTLQVPAPLLPLLSLPPSTYIQSYFALLATGVLALQLLPALQSTLLTYGPRDSPSKPQPQNPLVPLLRKTGLLIRVPHAWFSHFYLALLSFQLFWAAQYLVSGSILSAVAEREAQHGGGAGVSFGRVVLAWGMLTAQGARRLYECWFVMRPSASQMLGVHWVLSVLVYFGMSMAVWMEGSGTLNPSSSFMKQSWYSLTLHLASLLSHQPQDATTLATPRTIAAIALFIAASIQQHRAHTHLASLRKYTLPHEGLFRYIVCPHYTCECLIYVALAAAAAPDGRLFNGTLLAGLFFVAANLGATANNTGVWYAEKFGAGRVPRWRMVPFVF